MSVHSLDHESLGTDRGYKGYHIDQEGEVTEFYDHRDDEPATSSVVARQPLVTNGAASSIVTTATQRQRRPKRKSAGCCDSCVNILTVIGRMPFATGFALLFSWVGTAMFIAGGWTALDATLNLFLQYGPLEGNPARDPPPRYILTGGTYSQEWVLVDSDDLGNRVPQVFESIKYSFYGIIPFMLLFTIMIACDNHQTSKNISCKRSSSGICFTTALIFGSYMLILAFIFFLAFTTLGVYYYRISMLRCSDLTERGYTDGVFSSICIDLVQLGLIMFQNTADEGFGKICGPGDSSMKSYGRLDQYCDNYYYVYQLSLVCFAGCLLIIISMMNFLMILTANYNTLTKKRYRVATKTSTGAPSMAATSRFNTPAPPPPHVRSVASASVGPPPYVVTPTRERYRDRRSSKDIELDYIIDDASSFDRRREVDSHMGVDYYYRR